MEHIVQFAVGIDDDRIRQICEESAAKQIIDDVKVFSHGKESAWSNKLNENPSKLKDLFVEEIDKFIKEHSDEILQSAVQEVVKNFARTKKFKDAIGTAIEEINNG